MDNLQAIGAATIRAETVLSDPKIAFSTQTFKNFILDRFRLKNSNFEGKK